MLTKKICFGRHRKVIQASYLLLLCLIASGCATTRFSVSRIAPAKYDITGIKRVGIMGFGTENPTFTNGAIIITSTIENKLTKNGFFNVSHIPQQTHPVIFTDVLAKAGKLAGVDMLVLGLVDMYNSRTLNEMKKIEEEVSTGKFRTENYVENGVQKSRQVEIKEKRVRYEPVAKREAVVTFRAYALRTDNAKYVGKEIKSDGRQLEAQGQNKINALPSEQYLLSELTDQLTSSFVGDIAPHEVIYNVELKNDKACKEGIKLAKEDNWAEAIAVLESAVNSDPANHVAMYNLGVANEYQRNYEEAAGYYNDAIKLSNKRAYNDAWFRVQEIIRQNKILEKQVAGQKNDNGK